MDKKIAIITACYNAHPNLVWNHFVSIDMQYMSDEIIHVVVDDNSSDSETRATLVAAAERRKDYTVLISSKENGGPGAARNRAIRLLSKLDNIKYACLLDIDDYFECDALKIRSLMLDDDPSLIAVYGNKFLATWDEVSQYTTGETEMEEIEKIPENVPSYDKPRLMRECYIPSCSVMFRWEPFLQHIGHFREDVRLCEDWLIWRKLSMLGKFKKIDMPIYTQTMHGGNLTTNPSVLAKHRDDMITTQIDFNEWLAANAPKGILKP